MLAAPCYAPASKVGALSDNARLTYVYNLSRTSGLSPEQRGLGRLKLAHVTRDSDTTFKVKRSKVNLQGAGTYCGGLQHSLFKEDLRKVGPGYHLW